jgi:hypothetical protein
MLSNPKKLSLKTSVLCNIQLMYAQIFVKQKHHTTPCHHKSILFADYIPNFTS